MKSTPSPKLSGTYEVLVALLVTTLIVSNIASVKLVQIHGLIFDAGTILFPLAYIIGDIITEIYGFKRMRRLIYIALSMLIMTTVVFWVVQLLPAATDWTNQGAYDAILGVVWRIAGASVVAFLIGELLNTYVLARLKVALKGKRLWGRLVGSTAIGSLVDTTIFTLLAFGGTLSASTTLNIIATVYAIKLGTEIILSPVTVQVIRRIKAREGIDVYEKPSLTAS